MKNDRETSIRRAIEVLLALGTDEAVASGGFGVTRIAERLEREKSQVSRALKALAEYGLVERNPDALTYRLGWRISALAQVSGRPRFLADAVPVLARLVAALNESAHLSVLQGTEALTLLSDSPQRPVQATGWVGHTSPTYCTSAGQALLLDLDREELEALFVGVEFRPLGPRTARSVAELAARLAESRARGYVIADEDFEQGLVAVAAPVRDLDDRIMGCLNVSAPRFRFSDRVHEAGKMVRDEAQRLSIGLRSPAGEPVA